MGMGSTSGIPPWVLTVNIREKRSGTLIRDERNSTRLPSGVQSRTKSENGW